LAAAKAAIKMPERSQAVRSKAGPSGGVFGALTRVYDILRGRTTEDDTMERSLSEGYRVFMQESYDGSIPKTNLIDDLHVTKDRVDIQLGEKM